MIFVDTSVWIAALRAASSPEAQHLRSLLDADAVALAAPVRVEILAGASRRDRLGLRRSLSALPLFFPVSRTWDRVDDWLDRSGDAGERFGFADLLIGSIAVDEASPVWSLDNDFRRMAGLKLLECYRPATRAP